MRSVHRAPSIRLETDKESVTMFISGDLRAVTLAPIESFLTKEIPKLVKSHRNIIWNMEKVTDFDTAAALMVLTLGKQIETYDTQTYTHLLQPEFIKLLDMVRVRQRQIPPHKINVELNWLERLGKKSFTQFHLIVDLFMFFGTISTIFLTYLHHVKNIRIKEILFEINESAVKAIGIVALTTFLIGVVIAYQSAVQLKLYGANIFIVDMLGISIFRELAPLITAIVVAGRSGSAYAAQIGVMKITEELDAMRTMGFDPYAFLVLPRIIALMLMMPILIFFADMMGVLGGMLVSNIELGLSPVFFLERFANVVDLRHFWIGLVKGPFFALLIALIGIYRGLQVKNDTQSIGFNTTKSVVESIFAVIICDALFSIILTNLGL
ncbi:MAG: ABC transporter permease [Campylobacterota bacterium]|nr:ABC transporter permease [Campylobacterota bacterium]